MRCARIFGVLGLLLLLSGKAEALPELVANGGFEIIMPKLASGAASRIKRYGLTFEAACTDKRLTVAQRAQVNRWYQDMTKVLMDSQPFRKLYGI